MISLYYIYYDNTFAPIYAKRIEIFTLWRYRLSMEIFMVIYEITGKKWCISFRFSVNDIREIIRKLLDYLRILISPGIIASRSRAVGFV